MVQILNYNDKKIRLAVVTSIPFPNGLAATNRIISYSKGLVKLGHDVSILTTHYANKSLKSNDYCGITYTNFRHKSDTKTLNIILLILSIFKIFKYLLLYNKMYNVVIIVSNNAPLILLTVIACRINNVKIIQEKSEFPFVLSNEGIFGKIWSYMYTNTIYKLFDGMIIMTYPLLEYFRNKTKKHVK